MNDQRWTGLIRSLSKTLLGAFSVLPGSGPLTLLVTSASLLVTSALLVVTMFAIGFKIKFSLILIASCYY